MENEKTYTPTEKDKKIINRVYDHVQEMINTRNKTYPEFNDRTLNQYVDDSDKRLNSYVEDRETAGKEDWQANVSLPTIRDKMKRLIAGFALSAPDNKVEAYTEDGNIDLKSLDRGDIVQKLLKSSYTENNNPTIDHFWESWECGGKGTIIVYEGYLKTKHPQKFIESINIETGEVKFSEREVHVNDKCISYLMPITELFIPTFRLWDIQELPYLAWVKYYDKDLFDYEFGSFAKAKYVNKSSGMNIAESDSFYHKEDWSEKDRAGEDKIEVIRYYSRIKDEYIIIANGVLLAEMPLLWEFNGRKVYPFSKSILEPFVGKHFFYGKSLPDILTGQYDLLNTYFNTVMDKGFKNLNVPMLVGGANQDALDIEDDYLSTDTKIYVTDVNQVKPMPIEQISQADVSMIQLLAQGIEDSSPSLPHLLQKKAATAREVVISEERIRELKAVYHEMLVELWRQKYELRLANIKTHYPIPRKVYKDGEVKDVYRTFTIDNTYLDKDLKERGTLAIQFMKVSDPKRKIELEEEAAVVEEAMAMKGIKYKKVILDPSYLDGYLYKISVIPESVYKTSYAKLQVELQEELNLVATFFPEIFMVNQETYFEEAAHLFNKDPQKMIEAYRDAKSQQQSQAGATPEGAMPEGGASQPEQAMTDILQAPQQ
jgi:hypothetical protein